MATTETLTTPAAPDMRALTQSLAGLQAMGGEKARAKIAALDTAWDASNGSIVATAHALGQPYKKTMDDLAKSPVKRIAADDPRLVAYQIGLADITQGDAGKPEKANDAALRATQERAAMQRLARNPDDERGMDGLIAVARASIQHDLQRTTQAKKTRGDEAR